MRAVDSRKRMNEFYSEMFLNDLTSGSGIWTNVENVTRVTFKSFHDILVKQNKQINELNKMVKGLKKELKTVKKQAKTPPVKEVSKSKLNNSREMKMYKSFILTQNNQKRFRSDLNETNKRLEQLQLKLEKHTISKADFSQMRRSKVDKTVFRKQLSSEYKQFEILLKNRLESIQEAWKREYSDDITNLLNNLRESVGEEIKKSRVYSGRHEEVVTREFNSLKEKVLSNLLKLNEFHKEYINSKDVTTSQISQIHKMVKKNVSILKDRKEENKTVDEHRVIFDEKLIKRIVLRKIMEEGILNKYCQTHVVPMFSKEIRQHLSALFQERQSQQLESNEILKNEFKVSQNSYKQQMNEWKDEVSKSIQNIITLSKIETNNFTQDIETIKERLQKLNNYYLQLTRQKKVKKRKIGINELRRFSHGIQLEIKKVMGGMEHKVNKLGTEFEELKHSHSMKEEEFGENLKNEIEEDLKLKFKSVKEKVMKMQESIRQLVILNTSRNIIPTTTSTQKSNNNNNKNKKRIRRKNSNILYSKEMTDSDKDVIIEEEEQQQQQQRQQFELKEDNGRDISRIFPPIKNQDEENEEEEENSEHVFDINNYANMKTQKQSRTRIRRKKNKKKKKKINNNNLFVSSQGLMMNPQQQQVNRLGKNKLLVFTDDDDDYDDDDYEGILPKNVPNFLLK